MELLDLIEDKTKSTIDELFYRSIKIRTGEELSL